MTSLSRLTIHELAPQIQRRAVSPVEVTRECLERIEAHDGALHTFIVVRPEVALAEARAAEEEIARGSYRGPLHGLPVGIKDNIAVAGWPTTNGSALMTDHIAREDADVVQRLRRAGAVVVGKNNMHEWALGGTSGSSAFGAVGNPWDPRRTPGGSSGGSAAAVSASFVFASVGTDNKGSVRIPASYSGVVGLKPTFGLVSRYGQLPPTSATTDHIGPLTKDVQDAALLLNVMAGYDRRDPTSVPSRAKDYTAGLDRGVDGLRVGIPTNFFYEWTAPEVAQRVREAVNVFASLGARVEEVELPGLQYVPLLDAATINEARAYLLPFARRGPSAFADPVIWERIIVGEFVRASDMVKAMRLRNALRQEFVEAMRRVDLLISPTTVTAAFPHDRAQDPIAANGGPAYRDSTTLLTFPYNLTGMPVVSVPCGYTSEGLPVGLSIAGRWWEDDLVLRAGFAYEQAATGGYQRPPMAG